VRTADVFVAWRVGFHAVFLHVRHHLVGNLGEHFLGKHHLAAIEVAAETAADELTERHELKIHNNGIHTATQKRQI